MTTKKVFGIISYFPNKDSAYHIETRKERSRRFRELLFKLEELWSDVDIMIIAQNWQDFELPEIKNTTIVYNYNKLGILGARRELRKRFLASNYDYLIMLDDDAMVNSADPQAYLDEIDRHPNGVGAIRKHSSPLQLFAISKTIYTAVDMPDIDAEKGQGFEDDVFVAKCFSEFPGEAYMFPSGIVSETSFKYIGEGKCPSTWANEKKYDWIYMRENTARNIYSAEHKKTIVTDSTNPTIDLIIPYVNGSDKLWVQSYMKATNTHSLSAVRFRPWGTLKYLLRGVERYMPFIRNVILIVAMPSQVPVWLDTTNVRVVYHEDFIPKKFLPTFNSCTIESFLWNIPELSDRIIYFNDDMFPIGNMTEDDFFTGDIPHIKFTKPDIYSQKAIYQSQCRSGIDMITKALTLPTFERGKVFRPYHISTAITKDTFCKVAELCKDLLPATVSMTRLTKNVNQYIYAYYNYFTNNYIDKTVHYKYIELLESNLPEILTTILYEDQQLVCLNDSDKIKDYAKLRERLLTDFDCKFPDKSRYEV